MVDTKSGIRLIYKGKSTGKEVECRLETEELKRILNQKGTEKESERQKLEELVNVTNVSCPMTIDEATILNKLTIEADKVVYNYTIDEEKVAMAALKSNGADETEYKGGFECIRTFLKNVPGSMCEG